MKCFVITFSCEVGIYNTCTKCRKGDFLCFNTLVLLLQSVTNVCSVHEQMCGLT